MNDTAKTLNEIIDIFGFGCEFGPEELFTHFNNPNEVIESLKEHELIEKNQISNKYYLSDIFTCTTFLSKHLKEDKTTEETCPEKVKYSFSVKKRGFDCLYGQIQGL